MENISITISRQHLFLLSYRPLKSAKSHVTLMDCNPYSILSVRNLCDEKVEVLAINKLLAVKNFKERGYEHSNQMKQLQSTDMNM